MACVSFSMLAILLKWPLTSVSRPKGRPFYGQAKGQLRLTWRSSAGPPQPPPIPLRETSPRESVSLGSQVALLPYEPSSLATPIQGAEWASLCSPAETCVAQLSSIHSPTAKREEGGGVSHQRGPAGAVRMLMTFFRTYPARSAKPLPVGRQKGSASKFLVSP